jgi:hypothetical protein
MKFVIESFGQAAEKGYEPPWGYKDWSEILQDTWNDPDWTNGLWMIDVGGIAYFVNSDGGEPEDQTLRRDWAWVADALNDAYAQGVVDGTGAGLRVNA